MTGLAVGGMIEVDGVTYVVLPGPPSELKPMVNKSLLPLLSTGQGRLYSRVLRFFGIGESQLVTLLADVIAQQTDPTLAPYAKVGEVSLRLSTKATDQAQADKRLDEMEDRILSKSNLKQLMYGYGDDNSLAQEVVSALKVAEKTISAAESLTAGLFQSTLTDFSGASKIFEGGFVTYSLEEKAKRLKIPKEQLEHHGMISSFTARKMAEQVRELTDSDFALGLTGVAGPEELENQPAGTVFIGLANRKEAKAYQINIKGRSRSDIRTVTVLHAFNLVRLALLNDGNLI